MRAGAGIAGIGLPVLLVGLVILQLAACKQCENIVRQCNEYLGNEDHP